MLTLRAWDDIVSRDIYGQVGPDLGLGESVVSASHTGIRVRQTSGQNLDDRIVSTDVVSAAREFVRRNVNA